MMSGKKKKKKNTPHLRGITSGAFSRHHAQQRIVLPEIVVHQGRSGSEEGDEGDGEEMFHDDGRNPVQRPVDFRTEPNGISVAPRGARKTKSPVPSQG